MSYLDKVATANRFTLDDFTPFRVNGRTLGWTHREFAETLAQWPDAFVLSRSCVRLADPLDAPGCPAAVRSRVVDEVMRALHTSGHIRNWRDEPYAVNRRYGERAEFLVERAALAHFGFAGYGVHLNGYVRDANGAIHMWVARRSPDKPTWPGLLDQMVAGGQPAALGLRENMTKECWEEAAISADIAARARAVGALTYVHGMTRAIRSDTVFCFDLELPVDFVPHANDGEVDGFELLPLADVATLVRDTQAFKFNCALVVIDFLIRHDAIAPDEPGYVEMCEGLRGGAASRYFDD